MPFDPARHHRRSMRLQGYDYSGAGVYFVTLCTFGRECLLGEIAGEAIQLSEAGQIVREEWLRSPTIRSEIALDAMVVMPNHLHGVVIVRGVGATGRSPTETTSPPQVDRPNRSATSMARATPLGVAGGGTWATGRSPAETTSPPQVDRPNRSATPMARATPLGVAGGGTWATGRSPLQHASGPGKRSLGAFIAGFKAATTKRINACRGTPGNPVWQRNYYDRIIRNEDELWRIREYIANNPAQWAVDSENPVVVAMRSPAQSDS